MNNRNKFMLQRKYFLKFFNPLSEFKGSLQPYLEDSITVVGWWAEAAGSEGVILLSSLFYFFVFFCFYAFTLSQKTANQHT
jgi:hypothetical protein